MPVFSNRTLEEMIATSREDVSECVTELNAVSTAIQWLERFPAGETVAQLRKLYGRLEERLADLKADVSAFEDLHRRQTAPKPLAPVRAYPASEVTE